VSELTQYGRPSHASSFGADPALGPRGLGLLAALVLAIACVATAYAAKKPELVPSTIQWAHGNRVYVAPGDSAHFIEGDRLVFALKKKPTVTLHVERVDPGGLASTVIASGSFKGVKDMAQLHLIAVEHTTPREPSGPVLVRIGAPGPRRTGRLWGCDTDSLPMMLPPVGYRVAGWAAESTIFVRDTTGMPPEWPRTLVLREFDDGADEEIAFERGELDAAVFWPGELSTRAREQPKWQDYLVGNRSRGVLAVVAVNGLAANVAPRAPSPADSASLDFMNRFLYRGDLEPWSDGETSATHTATTGLSMPSAVFERDTSCSRSHPIEGFFGRPKKSSRAAPALRFFYVNALVRPADSLAIGIAERVAHGRSASLRARADSLGRELITAPPKGPVALRATLHDQLGVVRVFTIPCPILCTDAYREFLRTLGPGAVADLIGKRPEARAR